VTGESRKDEICIIIGPSGQGKTTLLRLINMLDTPTDGTILFDGISLHDSREQNIALRRRMGMVFQTPVTFNETVFENIVLGLKYRESQSRRSIKE
jgi:tungstate transport system ATP-binding protein